MLERALRFAANVVDVVLEILLAHTERAASERRQAAGARQQILLHQDVIGDRDDVEFAGRAVEIDHLGHRELAVAPLGVNVEITQEKWFVTWHQDPHIEVPSFGRPRHPQVPT